MIEIRNYRLRAVSLLTTDLAALECRLPRCKSFRQRFGWDSIPVSHPNVSVVQSRSLEFGIPGRKTDARFAVHWE